jgi:hypothetical protein
LAAGCSSSRDTLMARRGAAPRSLLRSVGADDLALLEDLDIMASAVRIARARSAAIGTLDHVAADRRIDVAACRMLLGIGLRNGFRCGAGGKKNGGAENENELLHTGTKYGNCLVVRRKRAF